jgi:hypothetical protein
VERIQQALPHQPAGGGGLAVLTLAQLVELGEIALDRPPVGIVEQMTHQPAHLRLSGR